MTLRQYLLVALLGLATTSQALAAKAKKARWFEVEMILFTRDVDRNQLEENFPDGIIPIKINKSRDFMSAYLPQDPEILLTHLPECSDEIREEVDLSDYQGVLNRDVLKSNKAWRNATTFCDPYEKSRLKLEQGDFYQEPDSIFWHKIPLYLPVFEKDRTNRTHLVAKDNLVFKRRVQLIDRKSDLTPVLHLAWRQAIWSKKVEKPWRIRAGKNYSTQFNYDGTAIIETQDELEDEFEQSSYANNAQIQYQNQTPRLESQGMDHQQIMDNIQGFVDKIKEGQWQSEHAQQDKLAEQQAVIAKTRGLPQEVWEIDGLFKIYLRHYLFIEAQFNMRRPDRLIRTVPASELDNNHASSTMMNRNTGAFNLQTNSNTNTSTNVTSVNGNMIETSEPYLYAYEFNQKRRIRSKEIHYFDHPMMGMVIQVRRYSLPK